PAQLLQPGGGRRGGAGEQPVHIRPHEQAHREEPAGDQPAELAAGGQVLVDVVPLRVVAAGEGDHLLPVDPGDPQVERPSGREVLPEQGGRRARARPDTGRLRRARGPGHGGVCPAGAVASRGDRPDRRPVAAGPSAGVALEPTTGSTTGSATGSTTGSATGSAAAAPDSGAGGS